jgi:hypothetical protein
MQSMFTKVLASLFLAIILSSCASRPSTDPVATYLEAEKTARGAVLSAQQEKDAEARFVAFFKDVTPETIQAQTAGLYAENAWFNDTLKTLHGREAVKVYFLKISSHAAFMRCNVLDFARSGSNYYVRWTMDVQFKNSKETIRTIGMTQLRFDSEGRIIFHQDFWDSGAGFFEHVPVLGAAVRWIKSLL